MTDDAPTLCANDDRDGAATAVEAVLAAWLDATDAGEAPRLQDYLTRLPAAAQRERFLELLDQVAFADANLPLRLRPRLVIGDRYELLDAIGAGGMGQVWRALDRKLAREVAVKVLSLAASAALDLDRLVEREGRLLAKLSHPGIVRIQDVGRDGEHRFLVMDLVRGMALDDLIDEARERQVVRREPFGANEILARVGAEAVGIDPVLRGDESWPRAAVAIVVALLRTLEAAHEAGVVHRDLKPANVRIVDGGSPVLLDFGIGIATGSAAGTLTAGLFGTAQYAAPEQWQGGGTPSVRTDVYQAGLVLYELLTLRRCFASTNPMETMRAVRDADYPRPRQIVKELDAALESCVLRAMDVDAARRYGTARAFRADLERFLAGQAPTAAAPTLRFAQRVRAFVRRRRSLLSLGAAALAGALLLWSLRPARPPSVLMLNATSAEVTLPDPRMMVAFRIAQDTVGRCWCAPVRLDSGSEQSARLSFGHELPAGNTLVSLRDVVDPTRYPTTLVSTMFSDGSSETDRARFAHIVDAMERARRTIADRDGEWLDADEFRSLFRASRGADGIDVPIDAAFRAGEWRSGGIAGRVVAPPPAATAPKHLALLVGIDQYAPAEGNPFGPLEGAENDVARVRDLLIDRFGFAADEILTLRGAEAGHEAIVRAFHDHLVRRAAADTRVVFWFSGHGSQIPDASSGDRSERDNEAQDETLVAWDSRSTAPNGAFDVADDELASLLAALPAKDVLVVTDCCHSGGVERGGRRPGTRECEPGKAPLDVERVRRFWPPDVVLKDDREHGDLPAVVHIAACGALEEAGEFPTPNGTYGALTWFLTSALGTAEPAASWEEVVAITRANIRGFGTRPRQNVQAAGDLSRAVFGGEGRLVASGYQVDIDGKKRLMMAAGRVHGIEAGAEVQLVDLDGKEVGTAAVADAQTTVTELRWLGSGDAPRVALRGRPKTLGERHPPLRVLLDGLDASLLTGSQAAAAEHEPQRATHRLKADGAGFVLCDTEGRALRRANDAGEVLPMLEREHLFRSLWEGVGDRGRFALRVRIEPATADEATKHSLPVALVHIEPNGTAVVGAPRLLENSGGALAALSVTNDADVDLHVAIVSATEEREVNVVFGRERNNVVKAHETLRRLVVVGPGEHWPADRTMVDRYVVVATARYADFKPFAAKAVVLRGGGDVEALPPLLREAMGGARTRGPQEPNPWGVACQDLHLVTTDAFPRTVRQR